MEPFCALFRTFACLDGNISLIRRRRVVAHTPALEDQTWNTTRSTQFTLLWMWCIRTWWYYWCSPWRKEGEIVFSLQKRDSTRDWFSMARRTLQWNNLVNLAQLFSKTRLNERFIFIFNVSFQSRNIYAALPLKTWGFVVIQMIYSIAPITFQPRTCCRLMFAPQTLMYSSIITLFDQCFNSFESISSSSTW